jgi:hypothetical protein
VTFPLVVYIPFEHVWHAVLFISTKYVPALQHTDEFMEIHRLASVGLQFPVQELHALDPVFEESPGGHGNFFVRFRVGQYVFTGHGTGEESPVVGHVLPSGHATGEESPVVGHTLPSGHATEAESPVVGHT